MGMSRQSKEEMVTVLSEKFSKAKAAIIANFTGLDVLSVSEVRNKFREAEADYKVVKNTLVKRAIQGTPLEGMADAFSGPTAVAFKFDEEFGKLGKAAKDLTKKFKAFQVKAAFIEEELILDGERAVETMAALPTLDEARAMLLGVFNAPASQLLGTINAPGANLLGVIQAKSDKDKEAA